MFPFCSQRHIYVTFYTRICVCHRKTRPNSYITYDCRRSRGNFDEGRPYHLHHYSTTHTRRTQRNTHMWMLAIRRSLLFQSHTFCESMKANIRRNRHSVWLDMLCVCVLACVYMYVRCQCACGLTAALVEQCSFTFGRTY